MPSNSEIIEAHNVRLNALLDQITESGGFVYVDTQQTIKGLKIFSETVGIANVNGTTDYLKHINNNFLISTSTGTNLLNIDEGLNKIYAFNKELAFKEDIGESTGGGTVVTVGSSKVDSLLFDSDPQTQITAISNRVKPAIVNVSHNENTGEFTFTRDNGTSFTVDTLLEKVVTNFTYNEDTQNLELKLEDGTVKYIPMTAFIDDYTGSDGDVVTVSVSNDNKISAVIKNGTITKNHLSETVQATLNEVGSNAGKIDTILNSWNNIEQVETVYDMTSDDISINWGFRTGLYAGQNIPDKDFTKYKRLRCYCSFGTHVAMVFDVDLTIPTDNAFIGGTTSFNQIQQVTAANDTDLYFANVLVSLDKTYFRFVSIGWQDTSGKFVFKTNTTDAPLTKIEGVY